MKDGRVRYTHWVIQDRFLALLQEKPASRITVTELCEQCQINRATFYKHYRDVPDLLEQMENELTECLKRELSGADLDVRGKVLALLRAIKSHGSKYLVLLSANADPMFGEKLFRVCQDVFAPRIADGGNGLCVQKAELLYCYLASGSGGILSWWVAQGMAQPAEEVAETILELSAACVRHCTQSVS